MRANVVDRQVDHACDVFGSRLESALNECGKTRKAVCAETGVAEQTVSAYISGKRMPTAMNLVKLCTSVGVSGDWLLGLR